MYEKNLNTSKTDTELKEKNITDSIVNNIKINYQNEGNFPMLETSKEINKDRIKEEFSIYKRV